MKCIFGSPNHSGKSPQHGLPSISASGIALLAWMTCAGINLTAQALPVDGDDFNAGTISSTKWESAAKMGNAPGGFSSGPGFLFWGQRLRFDLPRPGNTGGLSYLYLPSTANLEEGREWSLSVSATAGGSNTSSGMLMNEGDQLMMGVLVRLLDAADVEQAYFFLLLTRAKTTSGDRYFVDAFDDGPSDPVSRGASGPSEKLLFDYDSEGGVLSASFGDEGQKKLARTWDLSAHHFQPGSRFTGNLFVGTFRGKTGSLGVYTLASASGSSVFFDDFQVTLPSSGFPPSILVQPAHQSVAEGQSVTLRVVAKGDPDPHYQWTKNGALLPGESGGTLFLPAARLSDAGHYSVTAINTHGEATSQAASLTVKAANAGSSAILRINTFAGLRIAGTLGTTYIIETADDPAAKSWSALASVRLESNPQLWIDMTSDAQPKRFYRATMAP